MIVSVRQLIDGGILETDAKKQESFVRTAERLAQGRIGPEDAKAAMLGVLSDDYILPVRVADLALEVAFCELCHPMHARRLWGAVDVKCGPEVFSELIYFYLNRMCRASASRIEALRTFLDLADPSWESAGPDITCEGMPVGFLGLCQGDLLSEILDLAARTEFDEPDDDPGGAATLAFVDALLSLGADPNRRYADFLSTRSWTALLQVCWVPQQHHADITEESAMVFISLAQMLVNAGADPNLPAPFGLSPAMAAARSEMWQNARSGIGRALATDR